MKAGKRVPNLKRFCVFCGREFLACNHNRKYCSDAHRKADKRLSDRASKPQATQTEVNIKRWKTKSEHIREVPCVGCPRTFLVDGNTPTKIYHSRACKQKAYRERKAYKGQSPLFEYEVAAK